MKKGFFIVFFLLASVFAFADSFNYSFQFDDNSIGFDFGTSKTTITSDLKKAGWKLSKATDNACVFTKENQYFDGIKIHQLIFCFENEKYSECSVIFLPSASEKITILNHIIDCSLREDVTFKGTNTDKNGLVNYHYFDSDNNHLTFSIPNTESATIWAISFVAAKNNVTQSNYLIGKNLSAVYNTLNYGLILSANGTFVFVVSGGNIDGMAIGTFAISNNKINFNVSSYSGKNAKLVFRENETFNIEKATSDLLILKNTNPPDAAFSIPIRFEVK